ncbi:glutamyl-tRNA reductase-binding protein chloroplastic [Phtheirospermum japonicum]|uniref:Glutamyl-tRNA reductase-binding protein chloroplastic n=1 Tax=Phtheirospermum japonicum TaxID=374723 RepID=A0A830B004_9LAMI|nr:glutamyl-tRNA reductase-binding protein chloroplastic [Phtheirospermum japonicum]
MMKSVVVQQLRPFIPQRFLLPRLKSSSPFSSKFTLITNYPSSSLLSQSQIRAAPNQDASFATTSIKDEVNNVFQLIQAHQEKAARLPPTEEIKTILHHSSRGALSTFSLKYEGYPSGSMVDFACDAYGSPLLAVSSLAVHTKDLLANPKCSLLVAKDPEDRTDLVIVVHGDAIPVSETEKEDVRTAYLARHPNAFWVDFGDFQFLRIEPEVVRYVSGVATALLGSGEFTKEEFRTAKVDPIYQFSKPITSHMNKDHADDTKLIVQHSTSVPVDYAYMLDMDSLGFNVKAGYQGNTFKLRIPFTRRAEDRKDVKTLIVEMLQAARTQAG